MCGLYLAGDPWIALLCGFLNVLTGKHEVVPVDLPALKD